MNPRLEIRTLGPDRLTHASAILADGMQDNPLHVEAFGADPVRRRQHVRQGLPPASVVSVTGIPVTPAIEAMRQRGVLARRPMFEAITEHGVPDGRAGARSRPM